MLLLLCEGQTWPRLESESIEVTAAAVVPLEVKEMSVGTFQCTVSAAAATTTKVDKNITVKSAEVQLKCGPILGADKKTVIKFKFFNLGALL